MKRALFMMVAVAFVAVSCKNKSTAKMMEGTWNEVKINGIDVPLASQDQITFGKCNGGDKADCDLTITDAGGTSINYDYTVKDKGATLTLQQCVGLVCVSTDHTITSITDNEMVIDWNLGSGSDYTGTYQKQ